MNRFKSALWGVFFSALFLGGTLLAGTVSKQHTFSTGQVLEASKLNDNFDDIYGEVNGQLDDDNVDELSAAKITGTAVTLTGGSEQTIVRDTQFTGTRTDNGTVVMDCELITTSDATPDVSTGSYCYRTDNLGNATTITDFDGAVEGQVFLLHIADVDTTITGNSSVIATADYHRATTGPDELVGGPWGATATPATDERLSIWTRFISISGVWHEMGTGGGCCVDPWNGYTD